MKAKIFVIALSLVTLSFSQASSQIKRSSTRMKSASISAVDLYRAEAAYSIEKNWKFDRSLARDQKLEAEIVIKVLPDGRVSDFEMKKASWNKHMDASVLNAVIKSIPFPPFPPGITEPFLTVAIRFTPEGL